jgi:hypothetical protein
VTETSLVHEIDSIEHLLEVEPDLFLVINVLDEAEIFEEIAIRDLFENYIRTPSLIDRLIKYLKTVWLVLELTNQVGVWAWAQNIIDLNFFLEIITSRIIKENFDCNSSVFLVGSVPTSGLAAITQYIGACVSSIKNVSIPQFIFFGWLQWFDHRIF